MIRSLATGVSITLLALAGCSVELDHRSDEPLYQANTVQRPIQEGEPTSEFAQAVQAANQQSVTAQLSALMLAQQTGEAANARARTQQRAAARQARQTSDSTNPAFSRKRTMAEVARGQLAGSFDLPPAFVADFERILGETGNDGRERLIQWILDSSDTFVTTFTNTGPPFSATGAFVEGLAPLDPTNTVDVSVHTHPFGIFGGFDFRFTTRHSSVDLDVAGSGLFDLDFVLSNGVITAVHLPSNFTPPSAIVPFGAVQSAIVQAREDATIQRKEDNFRRNTGTTFTDVSQYVEQVINQSAPVQDFLAAEGFASVDELLAESDRLFDLAFDTGDFSLLDEVDRLDTAFESAQVAGGLRSLEELFAPCITQAEYEVIDSQAASDFIADWASANGAQVFDGRLGSPTMTRVP